MCCDVKDPDQSVIDLNLDSFFLLVYIDDMWYVIYIYIYIQYIPLCFRPFQQHPGLTIESSELVL